MNTIVKKICILGPEGVGKTSLIRRFVDNAFDDEYRSTIGVQISQKDIPIDDNNKIQFIIWDLEGFDVTNDYPLSYLGGAGAFVFVSDATRENTSSELVRIYNTLTKNPLFKVPTCIAINKSDLISKDNQELIYNKLNNSGHFTPNVKLLLTSAKDDQNVSNLFGFLAKHIWEDYA